MKTRILIIGGGLAGLAIARELTRRSIDFCLVEGRKRFGGRILSGSFGSSGPSAKMDFGPTWFWPGEERMRSLASELGIKVFEQFSSGENLAEDRAGTVHRGQGWVSMAGSIRIAGGAQSVIDGLVAELPDATLKLNWVVSRITRKEEYLIVENDAGDRIEAEQIVLALPPRLAAEKITFEPSLEEGVLRPLSQTPTWMAGQAKIVAIFDQPFWRDAGLSGDAMSQRGPMVEIHDASPMDGSVGALFGFVGFPADVRQDLGDELITLAREQLVRLFGEQASRPNDVILMDWAREVLTATTDDHLPLAS